MLCGSFNRWNPECFLGQIPQYCWHGLDTDIQLCSSVNRFLMRPYSVNIRLQSPSCIYLVTLNREGIWQGKTYKQLILTMNRIIGDLSKSCRFIMFAKAHIVLLFPHFCLREYKLHYKSHFSALEQSLETLVKPVYNIQVTKQEICMLFSPVWCLTLLFLQGFK